MCGIAGMISQAPLAASEKNQILRANDLQTHRGPDGCGHLSDVHVILAMRRLSIIDLQGGWQPLYNEDRTLALVANGEVYNFIELRKKLQSLGHCFSSGSDCETILHLYEEYGVDCVQHLRGMYAFALWDRVRQRLLLVRDRMGEKPLFLVEKNQQLIFGSELKILVQSGIASFQLDPAAIDAYFHYQYVPDPATPLLGVRKLPAGCLLVVELNPWRVQERRYWDMEDAPPVQGQPAEIIRAELERVSELVVRSDVPVGVALSGGLDSSAITALAARKYPGQMHAFCVGYSGKAESDERADARQFADYLGIPFHEVELDLPEVVEFFPQLQYWRDSPIADISGQGYFAVMKMARDCGIRVMLQGQGGDELFWGYGWVQEAVARSLEKQRAVQAQKWSARQISGHTIRSGLRNWLASWGSREGKSVWTDHAVSPDRMIFIDQAPDFILACEQVREIYTQSWRDNLGSFRADMLFTFPHPWPRVDLRITRLICDTYLRENGITQGDRLSMASGVELRLPLLDYRLVETVIGLRKVQADHSLSSKAWLKAALKDVLPEWVMQRPKRGFAPPVRLWHQALFARYGKLLRDGYLVNAGVLLPQAARALSGGPFPTQAITPLSFKALVLEMWCRAMLGEKTFGDSTVSKPTVAETSQSLSLEPSAELAPVALFVYKRPNHTRQVLESLSRNRLAEQSHLYIFADAPRKSEDREAVTTVRQLIREKAWCGRVHIIERDENWGLSRSIIEGTTGLVERFGRAIVLEDDLLVAPDFLSYMNEALLRYEHEPRVMQVSGHLLPIQGALPDRAFFLPLTTSWGWATWKRAWQHFDSQGTGYARLKDDPALRRQFDLQGAYPYSAMLQAQREGRVDSWAIRWYLTTFLMQGLTLYPGRSLVRNIGFDGSGTNCTADDSQVLQFLEEGNICHFPVRATVDAQLFQRVILHLGQPAKTTWLNRLGEHIQRVFKIC